MPKTRILLVQIQLYILSLHNLLHIRWIWRQARRKCTCSLTSTVSREENNILVWIEICWSCRESEDWPLIPWQYITKREKMFRLALGSAVNKQKVRKRVPLSNGNDTKIECNWLAASCDVTTKIIHQSRKQSRTEVIIRMSWVLCEYLDISFKISTS